MNPRKLLILHIFISLIGARPVMAANDITGSLGCDTLTLGKTALEARKSFSKGNKDEAFALHVCALQRFSKGDASIDEFIDFHNTFSTTLLLVGAHELSARHARKAYEISINYHNNFPSMKRAMTTYGNQMLLNGYADSALHYYVRLYAGKTPHSKPRQGAGAYNNIGMAYAQLGQYDSASTYYDLALDRLIKNRDHDFPSGLYLAIFDNVMRCLWKANRVEEQKSLIDSFRTQCRILGSRSRQMRCELLLAEIALDQKDFDQAQVYLESLAVITKGLPEFTNSEYQRKYGALRLAFHDGKGQLARANYYSQRMVKTTDSMAILNKEFLELIIKAQPYYEAAAGQIESRLARVEEDNEQSHLKQDTLQKWLKTVIVFALIVLLSVIIITLFFKNRQNALEREKQQKSAEVLAKEQKLEELEKEIELRKNDLESFTLYLNVLKETREDVKKTIEKSIQQTGEDGKQTLRQLLRQDKTAELMVDRTDVLYKNVESISAGFYERLRTTYPDLSPTEMELCAYLRAGLTNGEIAQRRNIQTKSVRMTKYRLKKKLDLSESQDINEFIRKL